MSSSIVLADDDEDGVTVSKCVEEFSSTGFNTEQDIRETIRSLASKGYIYATINRDHYLYYQYA